MKNRALRRILLRKRKVEYRPFTAEDSDPVFTETVRIIRKSIREQIKSYTDKLDMLAEKPHFSGFHQKDREG